MTEFNCPIDGCDYTGGSELALRNHANTNRDHDWHEIQNRLATDDATDTTDEATDEKSSTASESTTDGATDAAHDATDEATDEKSSTEADSADHPATDDTMTETDDSAGRVDPADYTTDETDEATDEKSSTASGSATDATHEPTDETDDKPATTGDETGLAVGGMLEDVPTLYLVLAVMFIGVCAYLLVSDSDDGDAPTTAESEATDNGGDEAEAFSAFDA